MKTVEEAMEWFDWGQWQTLRYTGPKPTTKEEAFLISIAKWRMIVKQLREDWVINDTGSTHTCGLCIKYLDTDEYRHRPCFHCPIFQKTGERWCDGTPIKQFEDAHFSWEKLEIAEQELKFLEDLYHEHFPQE
jgi:hypothetical protein